MEIATLNRNGNFSSSNNWKLTTRGKDGKSFGKPALTYIQEKNLERKLGRPLQKEVSAKETSWGNLVEKRAFDLLPLDYKLESKTRYSHPIIPNWTGAPDNTGEIFVGDIKCPFTLKSFCLAVDTFGDIEKFKDEKPENYWQLISNAILTGKEYVEIVYYVPYLSELSIIREMAENFDGDQNKISWINWAQDDDLPYLIEGGHYKNLNIFRFKAPQEDIEFLTESVIAANKLLVL